MLSVLSSLDGICHEPPGLRHKLGQGELVNPPRRVGKFVQFLGNRVARIPR